MEKRTFKIYRYDPEKDAKPYMETVEIELEGNERMLLDALIKLKAKNPTLSFRRSCREGVCGSDAMNINGKNGLACLTNMRTLPGTIVLKPLPGLPVVRDLIVDMTQFFKQYDSIKPYLINDTIVACAHSIRFSTSSASTRAVLNTRDLSLSPIASTRRRSAAIFSTPSSMLACVRNTPACRCIVARRSFATSCEYSPPPDSSSRFSRASVRSAASAGSGLCAFDSPANSMM